MKILMIVANSYRHDSRVAAEAKALHDAGHKVSVIDWDRRGLYPDSEIIDGILVHTIRPWRTGKKGGVWSLQIFSFWMKAVKIISQRDFDVLHCNDLDTLIPGLILKSRKRYSLVYDAHEIYLSLLNRGRARFVKPLFSIIERAGVKKVDKLIVADETYVGYFKDMGYEDAVSISNFKELRRDEFTAPEREMFTLCYLGVLSKSRFITELIDVVKDLDGVRLVIGGAGALSAAVKEASDNLENVEFLGRIPQQDVIPLTETCHCVVCMIDPSDYNNRIASANKQFEAMVAARPVIATLGTRSGKITKETKSGLVIGYSKEELRAAIIKLRDNPDLIKKFGTQALKAAKEKYNWSFEKEKLIRLYESLSR